MNDGVTDDIRRELTHDSERTKYKIVKRPNEEVCGLVAQWITRRSTEPKIVGSTPAEVDPILLCFNKF
uniref:Uncharacterized protein n=1 Tax=Setaria digitata TaxID=48799 RepID=A0A915PIM9_9BILA